MNKILKQAEKLIIPSEKLQKQKEAVVEKVIKLVEKQIVNYPQISGIEIVGSYAKGTWLPQKADVDIFIKFHTDVSEKDFTEFGKNIGFAALKDFDPYVRYAEHPFVEAHVNDTKVNLVPCYDVMQGNWKSSADRSPFHTRYMIKSLSGQMKNEVRLLKAFLKANDIYGAEIAKQGFSGYVSEVLVLNFGSFEGVIKAIAELKPGQVIGKTTKTFDTPIVIIDPIDENRNLGAAISIENVGKFVLAARAFLKKPSLSFFKKKKFQMKSKTAFSNVVVISFRYRPRSPDIIWGQLKRAATSLATQIEQEGFSVLRKSVVISDNNMASLLFLLKSTKLDYHRVRVGPDFFTAEHVEKFVRSNKKKSTMMWISEEGKIHSLQKRCHVDAISFVKNLMKKNLERAGVPQGLRYDIRKFKITLGNKSTSKSIKEAALELVSTDETIFSS
ncbi:MAG TPA: CCA tRNA nucleotidyltransferase [Candidatus Nitrosotenuis sp.]|jgi:tRNA nucleotidyltransferase (CCA-adding enzyme)|nr:CCA tRNA nucleotidyltransferase [Candidatus Nitrosotenuis sp.]